MPQALELGNRKAEDIEFEKWKSKVGRLDMNVREPLTLLRSSPSKQPRSDIYKLKDGNHKNESSSSTVTGGSRDAAVVNQQKASREQDEADASSDDEEDSDEADQDGSDGSSEESGSDDDSFADLEQHAKNKKQRQPSRLMLAFKEIKQSVRSYSDVAKVIVELPVAVDIVGKSPSNSSENDDSYEEEVSGRKKNACSVS
jgi:hypothetical protein